MILIKKIGQKHYIKVRKNNLMISLKYFRVSNQAIKNSQLSLTTSLSKEDLIHELHMRKVKFLSKVETKGELQTKFEKEMAGNDYYFL